MDFISSIKVNFASTNLLDFMNFREFYGGNVQLVRFYFQSLMLLICKAAVTILEPDDSSF